MEEKLRNMAKIESALAGFCFPIGFLLLLCLRLISKSLMLELKAVGMAKSELVKESLPGKQKHV